MKLLGVDVVTTSCKAALFDTAGTALQLDIQPTPTRTSAEGYAYYNPDELYETVCTAIQKVIADISTSKIALVGITSMAESGVLFNRKTGAPRSHFIPWFDMQAAPHAESIARQDDRLARFCKTGIHPSSKVSLAKLLWLRQRDPTAFEGAIWLSAADYIAYRLTGQIGTDYALAGRTFAFLIGERRWDEDWIRALNLPADIFPPTYAGGTPLGRVHADGQRGSGLPVGTPVAVAGHDHICGALAAGVVMPKKVFNSMGTAEVLLGTLAPRPLTQVDFSSKGDPAGGRRSQQSEYRNRS